MKNTFQKHEKLTHKKYFDALFSHGRSVKSFPVRAVFLEFSEKNFPTARQLPQNSQFAFSVPKKKFKKAVDRNLLKRRIREACRLNKHLLEHNYAVALIYLSHEITDYQKISEAVIDVFRELQKEKSEN